MEHISIEIVLKRYGERSFSFELLCPSLADDIFDELRKELQRLVKSLQH